VGGGLKKGLALPENHQNRVKDLETMTTESYNNNRGATNRTSPMYTTNV
jgi:hypothetical protein